MDKNLKLSLFRQAKDLGATHFNKLVLDTNEIFQYHFFNAAGGEIGHFIPDMLEYVGNSLTVHTEPRVWSQAMQWQHTPKERMP